MTERASSKGRAEGKEIEAQRAKFNAKKKRRAETKAKLKAFKLDWLAVVVGVFVFAIATIIFTPMLAEKPEEVVSKYVEQVVGGEDVVISQAQDPEVVERLSDSMEPIVIDESSPFYEAFTNADRVNVLLLGVNDNMTDTIMLGSYDMENQKVDIISIPRDTYYYRAKYKNASWGFQKINSVYRTEGIASMAEAVSGILQGMPIHYYAIVEYADIKKVMDVQGGVQIDIPFAMKYVDNTPGYELYIDIPSGVQTIDSSNVIEFLRFRHTNPSFAAQGYKSYFKGDIQRIEVQQNFVKEFIKSTIAKGKLLDVVKVALENVESDMTYSEAAKIATKALMGFETDKMESYSLPGVDKTMGELSFWVQNDGEITTMLKHIYGLLDYSSENQDQ